MKQVNHPNIRVNFDTGNIHFYNANRSAPDELRKIIDYVATVEIKDQIGGEGVWNFPALGEGKIDIRSVIRILKQHGYNGPITIEVEGIKGVEWDEATTKGSIEKSVKYLRSLGVAR
jgi:inosose dehydratase